MPTKLSRYAEGIMEAVWLAALILVPTFFDIYSSRIFEPDKLTLMRSLALLVLAAWLVKLIDEGGLHRENGASWFEALWQTPLLPQVILLALVYGVASLFSVTPRVSFWGSYQRLQGTYTTLSYLVLFAAVLGNMRRQAQVARMITAVILASLPVGLYGILQRFEIDPVPWGGNVAKRIASNMGNSIFVSAYLIMAFPLVVGRLVDSFTAILKEESHLAAHVARATVYVFTGAIQLIAIYLSGSRGPLLGLLAGGFFFFVVLSLYWNKRWLTFAVVALAGAGAAFLLLLNIPNGPLESIREAPWVGRFGQMLNTDQRTSRVRILIWHGASQLVTPHAPISFPDGSVDRWNALRPVIGYGPESMYVAYNPFYPPELGGIESRNASPDRSHNETWDALVITGFLGLIVYLALFTSLFYYGLRWLGLISSGRQRALFFTLVLGGGLASAAGFVYYSGLEFFGVGLPFGMMLGLIGYLPLIALFSKYEPPQTEGGRARALVLMMLMAAIVGHFVEIHFGIAIAATRTHFWALSGALVAVGFIMTQKGVYGTLSQPALLDDFPEMVSASAGERETPEDKKPGASRKKRRAAPKARRAAPRKGLAIWKQQALISGSLIGFLLTTLGFDFITNSARSASTFQIIWTSLTRLPNKNNALSYGVLALFITVLVIAAVMLVGEAAKSKQVDFTWRFFLATAGIGGGLGLLFWLFHASSLAGLARGIPGLTGIEAIIAQAKQLEALPTKYYIYLFFLLLFAAWFLPVERPVKAMRNPGVSVLAIPVVVAVLFALVSYTNLRIIHADISFKVAEPFARGGTPEQWEAAIALYQRANTLAPSEDHYYLFLGRGYLELARLLESTDPQASEKWMAQAETDLNIAQKINPLNTDHTANLGRLYRFWVSLTDDAQLKKERAQKASEYYARALTLSPQNAVLWNEWAILYMTLLNDQEKALATLQHSLEVDPTYDGTYAILADYYAQTARRAKGEAKQIAYDQAIATYEQAISIAVPKNRYNYYVALAGVYTELKDYQKAIDLYLQAVALAPPKQAWRVEDTIARLYVQIGDNASALLHANNALELVPEGQKDRIQQLIAFLTQPPKP